MQKDGSYESHKDYSTLVFLPPPPWVISIFKAIKKPLNYLSGFDIWRPQGDSNPCYRRERAVS
uniref:hypothetical protein n=1 Tax=uncultured Paraglaciecola sp. TaxID=1765024 RepID=UPI0030DB26A4|tara:strand:- start:6162 stop:6350 length:189 start_codon:yes stop_codon:yes gene_type:complete